MSLRLKLFVPFLLLAFGLAAYIAYWWYPGALKFHSDFHHEMLDRQLDSIGEGLVPLILTGRLDEIHGMFDELKRKNPDWRRLELFGRGGRMLYPLSKPPAAGVVAEHHGEDIGGQSSIAVHRHEIMAGGGRLGSILLEVDHDPMYRQIERSQGYLLGALALALALFILVLGVIVEILIRRPLGQLANASAALADGDYSHALPAVRQDEVGQLVVSFAGMRSAVERSQRDLRREIAERRKAEEGSTAANERFRFLVEQSLVGFYILQEGRVAYANPYLLERIGGSEADIGKPVREWIYPEDWPLVEENIRKRLAGEVTRIQYSFRLLARGGAAVEVDALGMATEYNGKPAIIGVMLDITEKKLAEVALKKSEAFLRTLFDTAGEGIWVIDDGKLTIRTNHALLDMLGTSEHDILYRSIHDFADEENAAAFRIHIAKSQEGAGQHFEAVLRHSEGRKIHCLFNTAPLYDEDGEIMGSFALVSDITERKFAEQALKRLSVELERRVQEEAAKNREKDHLLIQQSRQAAMGEMIGNIAHQWRQPLNALGLLLANIKDAYQFNELTEDYLNESTAKGAQLVQKMSATIDDFRNFFKPNREKVFFSPYRAIIETLSLIEASLKNHNIEVRVEGDLDVQVLGFPNEYSQVLLNVVGNAKDALLERQVEAGRITVRLLTEGNRVKVAVSDNAGGVPGEIMDKIFDPYFTTRTKGTGIGLYMSKTIIENNMNGELRVYNGDTGAVFEIIVPMVENGEPATNKKSIGESADVE